MPRPLLAVVILLAVILAMACGVPAEVAPGFERPAIFGIGFASAGWIIQDPSYDAVVYDRMAQIGSRSARMGVGWRDVERVRGQYDWDGYDEDFQRAWDHGLEVIAMIVDMPDWAIPPGRKPHAGPPKADALPNFKKFCQAVATRYRGRLKRYEIWNEENGYSWHEFNRADEYVPMLRAAYEGLKAGDPGCLVGIGGMDDPDIKPGDETGWRGAFYMRRVYEAGGQPYFDAVGDHPYCKQPARDLPTKLRAIHEVLAGHGDAHKPFWLTEYGWNTRDNVTEDEQARLLREYLEVLTRPEFSYVASAQYLAIADFETITGGFGLCDANLRPRPAFYEFQRTFKGDAPSIFNIQITDIGLDRATVTFETSHPSVVGISLTEPEERRVETPKRAATKHKVVVEDLKPGVLYEFEITARADFGKPGWSPGHVFTTLSRSLVNGGFEDGFRAGLANKWTCIGESFWLDGGTYSYIKKAHSGGHCQAIARGQGRVSALMYQHVACEAGAKYTLTAWSRAFADGEGERLIARRVGIDPTGGTDPEAARVVWSDPLFDLEQWQQHSVAAVAQGPLITVFLQGRGRDTGKHQRVLFDDVELTDGE